MLYEVITMAIGTLFTLFVLPSIYVLLAKDHSKERAKEESTEVEKESEPALNPH